MTSLLLKRVFNYSLNWKNSRIIKKKPCIFPGGGTKPMSFKDYSGVMELILGINEVKFIKWANI